MILKDNKPRRSRLGWAVIATHLIAVGPCPELSFESRSSDSEEDSLISGPCAGLHLLVGNCWSFFIPTPFNIDLISGHTEPAMNSACKRVPQIANKKEYIKILGIYSYLCHSGSNMTWNSKHLLLIITVQAPREIFLFFSCIISLKQKEITKEYLKVY